MSPDRPLSPRQEALLLRVVEAYIEAGVPIGSRTLVRAGRDRGLALDGAPRALGARGPGHARPSAHLRRPRADDRGLSLLHDAARAARASSRGRCAIDLSGARGELDSALRLTAEALAQATDLLAAVSAPVARHDRGAPRRARAAAAAARHGGRDHGLGRRRQAPLRVRAGRSTPACWSGRATTSTSRSSACGWARARCASGSRTPRSARRSAASWSAWSRSSRSSSTRARSTSAAPPACSPTCATASWPRCARS